MSEAMRWQARQQAAVARGIGTLGVVAARAENAEVWDVDGRRYVDFAAGIAVLNTGHRHPRVIEAVKAQLDAFTHTCFTSPPIRRTSSWLSACRRRCPDRGRKRRRCSPPAPKRWRTR